MGVGAGVLDTGHGVGCGVGLGIAGGEGQEAPGHQRDGECGGHGHLQIACRSSVQPATSQVVAVGACAL